MINKALGEDFSPLTRKHIIMFLAIVVETKKLIRGDSFTLMLLLNPQNSLMGILSGLYTLSIMYTMGSTKIVLLSALDRLVSLGFQTNIEGNNNDL